MYLPVARPIVVSADSSNKTGFFGWVDTVQATSFAAGQKVIDVQRFLHTSDGK